MRDTSAKRSDSAQAASRRLDLPNRTLLIVTALFWLYVTASNVLYAENIQVEVGKLTGATVFGPWQQRSSPPPRASASRSRWPGRPPPA